MQVLLAIRVPLLASTYAQRCANTPEAIQAYVLASK
jgi:hypothetical protein